MQKIYRGLTKEQKQRGVIFTSTLTYEDKDDNRADLVTHEVFNNILIAKLMTAEAGKPEEEWLSYLTLAEKENNEKIERLKNDKFFDSSPYKYNVIRQ